MMVAAMVVQAVGFAGVAGANNWSVEAKINERGGISYWTKGTIAFNSLQDFTTELLTTQNTVVSKSRGNWYNNSYGGIFNNFSPHTTYRVRVTHNGTSKISDPVTTPPIATITNLVASFNIDKITATWNSSSGYAQYAYIYHGTTKLLFYGDIKQSFSSVSIPSVPMNNTFYSLPNPITRNKTYTIVVVSSTAQLRQSQIDQIASGASTTPVGAAKTTITL
jgi:hypothetical protein